MTIADFIELLKNSDEAVPETDVEVDLFGYTKDWETISRNIREQHEYTCECCGLHITDPYDQHYIHVHHKNGRKIDNRLSNLQCLCLRCHANVDDNHRDRLINSGANRIVYEDFERKYPQTVNRVPLFDGEKWHCGIIEMPIKKASQDNDDLELPFKVVIYKRLTE